MVQRPETGTCTFLLNMPFKTANIIRKPLPAAIFVVAYNRSFELIMILRGGLERVGRRGRNITDKVDAVVHGPLGTAHCSGTPF